MLHHIRLYYIVQIIGYYLWKRGYGPTVLLGSAALERERAHYCTTYLHPQTAAFTRSHLRGSLLWSLCSLISAQVVLGTNPFKRCQWIQSIPSQQRSDSKWLSEEVCGEPHYLLSVTLGTVNQYSTASWCVFVYPATCRCVLTWRCRSSTTTHFDLSSKRKRRFAVCSAVQYLPFNLPSICLFPFASREETPKYRAYMNIYTWQSSAFNLFHSFILQYMAPFSGGVGGGLKKICKMRKMRQKETATHGRQRDGSGERAWLWILMG